MFPVTVQSALIINEVNVV